MKEVERAWLFVERALEKRYPELQKLLREQPQNKALEQDLYRMSRDIEELRTRISNLRRRAVPF